MKLIIILAFVLFFPVVSSAVTYSFSGCPSGDVILDLDYTANAGSSGLWYWSTNQQDRTMAIGAANPAHTYMQIKAKTSSDGKVWLYNSSSTTVFTFYNTACSAAPSALDFTPMLLGLAGIICAFMLSNAAISAYTK